MRRRTRRRPTGGRRATTAAVALILGGGGLIVANVYASAAEGTSSPDPATGVTRHADAEGTTVYCPDVGAKLTSVPEQARDEVDKNLAELDRQISAAYEQLGTATAPVEPGSGAADALTRALAEQRAGTIGRIVSAVGQAGGRPEGLEALASCTLRSSADAGSGTAGATASADADAQSPGQAPQPGPEGGEQSGNGPVAADYADITTVQPDVPNPPQRDGASRGTFATRCGVNAGGLFNSDNVIVAPGVSNGAHHFHDYVGNQSNTAFASDDDLAKADTSCQDKGDRSTYYWPVVRLQNGVQEQDADRPGGGVEGNRGKIVTPSEVTLTFTGSPVGKVTAMPRFLRIITGDAKAFVNGPANANASWSCTGYENRQLKDKYPLCPKGSDVVRTFRFQSCWDGRNIDSANHRTHVAFADADGRCAEGFRAIPQLVQRIVYHVQAPSLDDGGRTTPLFAVDSFPEQLHKPVTDHGDFINVFDDSLMREAVDCINKGEQCGAGAPGDGKPTAGPGTTASPEASGPPKVEETRQAGGTAAPTGQAGTRPPAGSAGSAGSAGTRAPTVAPAVSAPPQGQQPARGDATPKHHASASVPAPGAGVGESAGAEAPGGSGGPADAVSSEPGAQGAATSQPPGSAQAAGSAGEQPIATGTAPAANTGSLAETGARLWPALFGGALALAGCVLLLRGRRTSATGLR